MGQEIPSSHSTSVSSTKRYFKMQSACRPKGHLLGSFPLEGNLLANCLTPHMLYKPQHTPALQWYQYYCARTLAQLLLPVTAIRRLPFALLCLTSILLGFLQPRLITSALGLMHLALHMMLSLNSLNRLPCKGLVMKLATIFLVGHQSMLISFMFTRCVITQYRMLICLRLPLEALPFCSSRIELLLSCNNLFSMIPYPCDNSK
jgi:hypothetical protein